MEVIIIRLTEYKEKDYIVNALSKEKGIIAFRAPGALSVKSKFAGKLFLFSLADVDLIETKVGHTLRHAESRMNIAKIFTNPARIVALNIIGEVISKVVKDEDSARETFELIKNALLALGETFHLNSLIFLFLTNLMRILGSALVVNRCVSCGSTTNIIGVSFARGGLICKNCYAIDTFTLEGDSINILRYGFKIKGHELLQHEFSDEEVKAVLNLMLNYIEYTYNLKIMSKELLK